MLARFLTAIADRILEVKRHSKPRRDDKISEMKVLIPGFMGLNIDAFTMALSVHGVCLWCMLKTSHSKLSLIDVCSSKLRINCRLE